MTPRTRAALEASIEHWERNAKARKPSGAKVGSVHCALCSLFNAPETPDRQRCKKCPVGIRTKTNSCFGSPYTDAWLAHLNWSDVGGNKPAQAKTFRAAAREMVAFLNSLRPEE